jgi:dolichol-phosphate mannosyltransferase
MGLKSRVSGSSLAIVVPMYNEQAGAEACVSRILGVMPHLPWLSTLIVVDDGSQDRTASILKKLKRLHPSEIEIVTHRQNAGYGAGLVTGILKAKEMNLQWCLFMDSDLTNPPEDIHKFIVRAEKGDADVVKASRYMPGGKMVGVPPHRRLVSQLGNLWGRMCYRMGLHDYSNGFRMGRTNILNVIPYSEKKFAIILEEMYYLKKMKARVVEIPNILTARTGTLSTFQYNYDTFHRYLKYTFKAALI